MPKSKEPGKLGRRDLILALIVIAIIMARGGHLRRPLGQKLRYYLLDMNLRRI
jgi:hypothetical protein